MQVIDGGGRETYLYEKFLESKRTTVPTVGFEVAIEDLNPNLFDWQKAIVRWGLYRGRSAHFEDCGLGKTLQELETAHQIVKHTGGRALILAPCNVPQQTCGEAAKFGVPNVKHCREAGEVEDGITITNYERLHKFDPAMFDAILLDESSILKSFDGSTRKAIQRFASKIHYRSAWTATPAPNDLIELTNHAEFLDVMSGKEIIALFFKQDGNTTHKWRLKGHARQAFWQWMAQWSIAIRKPSDLGYPDGDFVLPELRMHSAIVDGHITDGFLFPVEANTMQERRQARRESQGNRVQICAGLVNDRPMSEAWVIWCELNSEGRMLARAINGAVEVTGSDSPEFKEEVARKFCSGEITRLVTKGSIFGWGQNWQHCHKQAHVGLSDSFEQLYQTIRRSWRFGQNHPVDVHIITADTEGAVVQNIKRKERQATEMFEEIVKNMSVHELNKKQARDKAQYFEDEKSGDGWTLKLGDSCTRIKEIASDSVGLTVFSPPFPGMYAYTNSPRDVGNTPNFKKLMEHFKFMIPEFLRITMPGRICCVHLTQEPVFKGREGDVALRDFRGDTIRAFADDGWLYYSEVTIDKNPMLKASRTKEGTLLFKTLASDSISSRPAMADYILVFKKPGKNRIPVRSGISEKYHNRNGWITADEWCEWAAPVWYRAMPPEKNEHQPWQGNYPSRFQNTDGIRETDVLGNEKTNKGTAGTMAAKDVEDEKHLCPLQLGVIERCIKLWSAPGDLVFSPFAGIGSEGYQALKFNRKFIGIELKPSYWKVACQNLELACKKAEKELIPEAQSA